MSAAIASAEFIEKVWNAIMTVWHFYEKLTTRSSVVVAHGRRVKWTVHGRFHTPLEFVWDGTAVDLATGVQAEVKHWKSPKTAARKSVELLAKNLEAAGILAA